MINYIYIYISISGQSHNVICFLDSAFRKPVHATTSSQHHHSSIQQNVVIANPHNISANSPSSKTHHYTAATRHRMPSGSVSPSLRGSERSKDKEEDTPSGGIAANPLLLKTVQRGT